MSENIVGHIDEMGNRIEELEKSIAELVNEAQSIDDSNMQTQNQNSINKPQHDLSNNLNNYQ